MVNKITKSRLKNLIIYDFWKMVAVSVIVCIVLVLTFNFVAKKPTLGQDFRFIIDEEVYMGEDIDFVFEQLFTSGSENGGFSYEMLKGETQILRSSEENTKNYMLNGVYADPQLAQDDALILTEEIYLQYVNALNASDLVSYINGALSYYQSFCDENGNLVEQKVYDNFTKTRGKDSRFRTKAQIEEGKKQELSRIKGLKFTASALKQCFELHPELLDQKRTIEGTSFSGNYAIKLDALNGNASNGKKEIQTLFKRAVVSENNETNYTASGLYLVIGENSNENGDLFYENLSVLYVLIKNYSTYLG